MKKLVKAPLLQFLVLGLALYWLEAWLNPPEKFLVIDTARYEAALEQWEQSLGRAPNTAQQQAVLDTQVKEELLFQEGMALGLEYSDVVQRRLLNLGEFLKIADEGQTDEQIRKQVKQMGLLESDSLVRRYIASTMEQLLVAQLAIAEPSEEQLAANYERDKAKYIENGRKKISHVYVSGFDEAAIQKAKAIKTRIVEQDLELKQAIRLGSNFYGGHHLSSKSYRQMTNTLGVAFTDDLWATKSLGWLGPYASAYGQHIVYVHDTSDDRQKTLNEPDVFKKVTQSWVDDQQSTGLAEQIKKLKQRYTLVLPERGGNHE